MAADGPELVSVGMDKDAFTEGVSHDGNVVAVHSTQCTEDERCSAQISVRDRAAGKTTLVASADGFIADDALVGALSGNGRYLASTVLRDGTSIDVHDLQTGTVKQLPHTDELDSIQISDDGSKVAVMHGYGDPHKLEVYDVATGQVTTTVTGTFIGSWKLSGDGSTLVYGKKLTTGTGLYSRNLSTGTVTKAAGGLTVQDVSGDARYAVVGESPGGAHCSEASDYSCLLRYNLTTHTFVLVNRDTDGGRLPWGGSGLSMSDHGNRVLFTKPGNNVATETSDQAMVRNISANTTRMVSVNADGRPAEVHGSTASLGMNGVLSGDGLSAVLTTNADNFGASGVQYRVWRVDAGPTPTTTAAK